MFEHNTAQRLIGSFFAIGTLPRSLHKKPKTCGSVAKLYDGQAVPVKTRQIERAEGLAAMKRQSTGLSRRRAKQAGKALSQRSGEREQRELSRRDARFDVHTMIERSRGAGRL